MIKQALRATIDHMQRDLLKDINKSKPNMVYYLDLWGEKIGTGWLHPSFKGLNIDLTIKWSIIQPTEDLADAYPSPDNQYPFKLVYPQGVFHSEYELIHQIICDL